MPFQRRSSIDMRRESVQLIMDRVITPLTPSGVKGKPPRIMEVPENVTVVESESFDFTFFFRARRRQSTLSRSCRQLKARAVRFCTKQDT